MKLLGTFLVHILSESHYRHLHSVAELDMVIVIEKKLIKTIHKQILHSEPQAKLPTSSLRALYFLFPPRTLTVWIRRGPIC